MMPTSRRRLKFFDVPTDAISPMPAGLREHYQARQLEHEQRGDWEAANRVNQWLTGAFATVADLLDDNLPPTRRRFLRRLYKVGVI